MKPGEAGAFALDGNLQWPNGRLPTNTSGGSLSEAYVHGFNLICEGVRQIRGTVDLPGARLRVGAGDQRRRRAERRGVVATMMKTSPQRRGDAETSDRDADLRVSVSLW